MEQRCMEIAWSGCRADDIAKLIAAGV